MVIVIYILKLLVLSAQVVRFRVRWFGLSNVQFGINTAAKVPFFCVLRKYFVLKMHKWGLFVRKT